MTRAKFLSLLTGAVAALFQRKPRRDSRRIRRECIEELAEKIEAGNRKFATERVLTLQAMIRTIPLEESTWRIVDEIGYWEGHISNRDI